MKNLELVLNNDKHLLSLSKLSKKFYTSPPLLLPLKFYIFGVFATISSKFTWEIIPPFSFIRYNIDPYLLEIAISGLSLFNYWVYDYFGSD